MPFKRRSRRRRRRRRFKGKNKALRVAYKALNQNRPETKNKVVTHTASSSTTSGTITNMLNDGLMGGTAPGSYIGKQVRLKNLTIRYSASANVSSTAGALARIIIGLWYDEDTPTVLDILSLASVHSPYSQGNATRYQVYFDRVYDVNNINAKAFHFTKKINFGLKTLSFPVNTISLASNIQIFLIEIGNTDSNHVISVATWRVRYTDA